MKMKYDLIVPLGCNCATAQQLKLLSLRQYSSPFDWLLCKADDALAKSCALLETRFKNFLVAKNLRRLSDLDESGHLAYMDEGTGFIHLHDFIGQTVGYDEVVSKYRRRIDRLYAALEKSTSVLFVFSAADPRMARLDQLAEAYTRLKTFVGSEKTADLFVMTYASDAVREGIVDDDGHIYVSEDVRPHDWAFSKNHFLPIARFLLGVKLKNNFFNKTGQLPFLARVHYKLNKHTAKYLQRKGLPLPVVWD